MAKPRGTPSGGVVALPLLIGGIAATRPTTTDSTGVSRWPRCDASRTNAVPVQATTTGTGTSTTRLASSGRAGR
jgi:hypothetical protein